jgi:serine/threonine protein kinase
MPVTVEQFVQKLTGSGLMSASEVSAFQGTLDDTPRDGETLAKRLVQEHKLTEYQAGTLCNGVSGPLVLGEYVILDKLGSGGMGDVYKALHRRMNRIVAVKTLSRSFDTADVSVERFHREVRAAARLNHANIVTAYDAGESGGTHYLVMEYVDGNDLAKFVRIQGPLPVGLAVEYILQAARGLEYAHLQGVIHRDIKPSNLLLDKNGTVKILDMGLARCVSLASGEAAEQDITREGVVVGTMNYLSPEQAMNSSSVDHRSDIYNLGCTLYFLITARYVYGCAKSLADVLLAHRDNSVPLMSAACSDVSAELDHVFQRMVAKRPAARYQSASQLIADLERCRTEKTDVVDVAERRAAAKWTVEGSSAGNKVSATTQTQSYPGAERRKPAPWLAGVAAIVVLTVAGVFGWLYAAGVIFSVKTADGTLVVEVNEPGATVTVFNELGRVEIREQSQPDKPLSISVIPGKKELKVEKDGFQIYTKQLSVLSNGKESVVARLDPVGGIETPKQSTTGVSGAIAAADALRERALAEGVIRHRGVVNYFVGSVPTQPQVALNACKETRQLPREAFGVWRVSFADVGREFDDVAFAELAALAGPDSSVINLNLNNTAVTSAGLRQLDRFPKLENLSIANTPGIADEEGVAATAEALRGCARLTTLLLTTPAGFDLHAADSAITAASVEKLKQAIPNKECQIIWGGADRRAN